jgi:hypothetical protein
MLAAEPLEVSDRVTPLMLDGHLANRGVDGDDRDDAVQPAVAFLPTLSGDRRVLFVAHLCSLAFMLISKQRAHFQRRPVNPTRTNTCGPFR